ncbi:hypothetical protein AXG93_961s1420 [Marchantia polymorpha subsp. ruderalis]|uniref:Uncharacterized protein n=1 Tax=Marchantia polymorpha subsp. ruderalis TaxID=1480154 RepID=A0A176VSX6_MARPO|nr:hypothetical protein AXG93_961s1420 [Marchantia polymorpha subsp. ruderalis]
MVPLLRYLDHKVRDDTAAEAQREFAKQRAQIEAELYSERIQNSTLTKELLGGSGAAVTAEEATRPSFKESPRICVATKILDSVDESSSEAQEVESVQGTPTGVMCEQVVPLLRYLDCKVAKYADPRYWGSYVELVRNRARIKVTTNPVLISLDRKYRELEEKNDVLHEHLTLSRKLQNAVLQLRDDVVAEAQREFAKIKAELHSERIQNSTLAEELVRQT